MGNTVHWTKDKVIEAMIAFKNKYHRWPESRDWWNANSNGDKNPSFTTICKGFPDLKWSGMVREAQRADATKLV